MEPDRPGLLTPERRRFVQRLAEVGVRVLVVGGEAVRAAGFNRLTKDLDIVVERKSEEIERILQVAAEFGFQSPRTVDSLANSRKFGALYVRLAPRSQDTEEITHHVDVLFADTYLPDFEGAFVAGVPTPDHPNVRYAGIAHLMAMKRQAVMNARRSPQSLAKDRADLEFLAQVEEEISRVAATLRGGGGQEPKGKVL
jgi:hypothetical protein